MSRDGRYRARYWDPEGQVYGIPTYWWKGAPQGLATRRQLRALGLCPGGAGPVAQVLWMRRRKDAVAYLYSIAAAKPKRVPDGRSAHGGGEGAGRSAGLPDLRAGRRLLHPHQPRGVHRLPLRASPQ